MYCFGLVVLLNVIIVLNYYKKLSHANNSAGRIIPNIHKTENGKIVAQKQR